MNRRHLPRRLWRDPDGHAEARNEPERQRDPQTRGLQVEVTRHQATEAYACEAYREHREDQVLKKVEIERNSLKVLRDDVTVGNQAKDCNTDAHGTETLANIKYSVATARRAWLSADQIANTRTWRSFAPLRKRAR